MTTFAASQPIQLTGEYPVDMQVEPPEQQSRLSILFRPLLAIPHIIVLAFIAIGVALVSLIAWFAILITGKYPEGMYNFVVRALHWQTRVSAYLYFLTGKYPPFAMGSDSSYPVQLALTPQTEGRNRLTVFLRIFLVIPHLVVLYFVNFVANILQFIAWIVGTFTGRVPEGIHNFLGGTIRWSTRTAAYAVFLTDDYPPFSMS